MFNWISKSTHAAALVREAKAEDRADRYERSYGRSLAECARLIAENKALNAKLAVFTAPRKRDARGHFLPASASGWDAVKDEVRRAGQSL